MVGAIVFAAALKVLAIGNSFSASLGSYFGEVARAAGCEVDFCAVSIGGCTLERHVKEIGICETNSAHARCWTLWTYASEGWAKRPKWADNVCRGDGKSLNELDALRADKWDVVTIQQASPSSWRPETFEPWATKLIDVIRREAPQAEIVIQETWSYNSREENVNDETGRKGRWNINNAEMYRRLSENYWRLSADHGNLRVIPTGTAVENFRRSLGTYDSANDVVGWDRKREGKAFYDGVHLNPDGQYLQALVWTAKLFGRDISSVGFVPPHLKDRPERVAAIKKAAMDAVKFAAQAHGFNGRVVLPGKCHQDPGAEFALVFVTDLAKPTAYVRAFADEFKDAVLVCAKEADRATLLEEVCRNYRVFRFPRGRIDLKTSDLARPDAKACLANYIRWGRYQAEPPVLTRYGARIYRKERKAGDVPTVSVPEPWRLVEGDDGVTGCDSRLYYFTVEADGCDLPPPEVSVTWPGVAISSVDGATKVSFTADGVVLTPTAKSGGACYLTVVQDGAIELALHHHVEGAQHGPYGDKPLPWDRIRASDNWRAACREILHLAGLADPKATDGASIKLYGFDSNFPNRHVDHPEHFHVMLEWDGWRKNNVGHYTLDERGFICGNNFLVCGDIAGGLPAGYHPQKPGETTDYVGPSGKPLFSLEMLEGGVGLVLRKPGADAAWRILSDSPTDSVKVCFCRGDSAVWTEIDSVSVVDDTETGRYVILHRHLGSARKEVFRYDRDTGSLKDVIGK